MTDDLAGGTVICSLVAFVGLWLGASGAFGWAQPLLSPRNLESPFPYMAGSTREWPILESSLPEGTHLETVLCDGDTVLNGEQLAARGLKVAVTTHGWLQVTAKQEGVSAALSHEC